MYDVVISGGTVFDGSGTPGKLADIAITGKKIAGIGDFSAAESHQRIDASGCIVTPGWVDVHTHYDGQATWDPILAPSSWHGVTTAVMGNCGVGFAPVRPGKEQFLIELMEGVEDIPGSALAEGMNWNWETFSEYLDALESMPRTIDIATQVPHAAVRNYVMGDRCNTDAQPTADELQEMATIVRDGMEAGALGFSTSRTLLHRDKHGIEMPGTFAPTEEMRALGGALKGLDHGVFELVSDHLGEESEWEWVCEVGKETGRPITVVWTSAEAFKGNQFIALAEDAEKKGIKVMPQIAGRPTGILHGLQSSFHIFVGHPTYIESIAPLPLEEQIAKLAEPDIRAQLLSETSLLETSPFGVSWRDLLQYVFPLGQKPDYEPPQEHSIAGIAATEGRDSFDVMYDLLIADGGKELFYQPLNAYENYDFSFFESVLSHPGIIFGLSDGGAHCGVIADAGMPSFILTHWCRDRKRGSQLPLELMIKKLSHDTAMAYGMPDRGLLSEGYMADVNVIDFDKLQLQRPTAEYDLPAGGRRLVQRVDGYRYTLKSGITTFVDGEHTGALPGTLVRGGKAA
jgi:N-acyl-D-aspartate/D-glutamate deacylase